MRLTVEPLTQSKHSVWIEIDTDRLKENLQTLKDHSAVDTKMLAVIKANAYGHGLEGIAKALDENVSYLGVSSVQEALELKQYQLKTPIFVFGQLLASEIPSLILSGVTLSVSSLEQAKMISEAAEKKKRVMPVHVKVDTGMGRLGIPFRNAIKQIEAMSELPSIILEGIYTHFPTAEEDVFTQKQIHDFSLLLQALDKKDIRFVFRHTANSTASLKFRDATFNMIRPGLMLYGLYPDPKLKALASVKPTLSLKSRIVLIKRIAPGESVGYGREFIAEHPTNIATIPIGYSHGYPFRIWKKASVLISGRRYPVCGRISMDFICVDLGDDYAPVGEKVTLIGEDGNESIGVEDIAAWAQTIPYEIVTGLISRIPRLYS